MPWAAAPTCSGSRARPAADGRLRAPGTGAERAAVALRARRPARVCRALSPHRAETIRRHATYIETQRLGRGSAAGKLRQYLEPCRRLCAGEERADDLDDQHRAQPLARLAAPAAPGTGRR